ncbi:glycoside hydrolase family 3 N-terminal domain-containing protein [Nesterenkonia haasae]|uniref:glycoside hydrolase family 3 N-terminal domain-containing protein n=1 Tax=Nesterenkonia haasae TaxID=2587813 RepID=UPI0013911F5C|nr:glycoside hydrolase family 3 N-terminal domain-containing protein [Nesterenkonia haasae]NDK32600.1 glycoside hydrolase family 3 protein [Nesterenkonia haasae]
MKIAYFGRPMKSATCIAACMALALVGCSQTAEDTAEAEDASASEREPADYTTSEATDGDTTFTVVENPHGGARLTFADDGEFELITEEEDGSTYAFKDMNGNGELDTWEDWREPAEIRAAGLADQLTIEQVAGLMLFSSHERAPGDGLTEDQETYLEQDHLRNVLNAGDSDVQDNVTWVNEMQAFVESLASEDTPYVPVNFSTDPRHDSGSAFPETGSRSDWPSNLGMAALFDAERVEEFGRVASEEYRALGISNALSPQIDLATEPRWLRVNGTFGENAELAAELAVAYVDGFQNSYEDDEPTGWGPQSVSTMIKHFPGDGAGEGGRESHLNSGKYAVFPGGNFDTHLDVFLAAQHASSMMINYSIMLDGEGEPLFEDRVGSAYEKATIDILRKDNDYDGVLVTDWGVTNSWLDEEALFGMAWGKEDLTIDERHFEVLRAGVDMFGGNNEVGPVLAAHEMWQEAYENGELEIDADTRWAQTGKRVLTMLFETGLYESPYLDLEESEASVGSEAKIQAGIEAQLDSVVLLKNDDVITESDASDFSEQTVYIPQSFDFGQDEAFGPGQYTEGPTVDTDVAEEYFGTVLTDEVELNGDEEVESYEAPDISDADAVVVGMRSPNNGTNFSSAGWDEEEDTWYPLSLQYRPYTADGENVRQESISGDIDDNGERENRSYFGETSRISNEADLDAFERAVEAVEASGRDIPIIVVLDASNPVVPSEFEEDADAIVAGFGVSHQALLEVALGIHEPQGRLPIGFPASMDALELQHEDVGEDHETYVDSAGNDYAYGYGLDWTGVLGD